MASSSTVIQEVIPALATALARLRRTPGRGDGWLEDALDALERTDAACYEQMHRRIGFARRLGDLASLDPEETATLTLGIFFHELLPSQPQRSRGATRSAWLEYLLRNEDWLAPAFALCEVIAADGWETGEGRTAAVAKLTTFFDTETLERHERPLQVLQNIGEVESPLIEELIPLLWSEEGQELCDRHFRRVPQAYKLQSSGLRNSFEILRRRAPRSLAEEAAVAPVGLFSYALPAASRGSKTGSPSVTSEPPRPRTDRPDSLPVGANFDQRRQALRARSRPAAQESASEEHQEPPLVEMPVATTPPVETWSPLAEKPVATTPPAETWLPPEEQRPEPRPDIEPEREYVGPARREEETMEQMSMSSPVRPGRADILEMMQKLRDVRLQLGEIQRIAVDAEQLLTGLAPQLDEMSGWIADLDAVVDRWRGRADIQRAA